MKLKTVIAIYNALNSQNFGEVLECPEIRFTRSNHMDGNYNGRAMQFNLADTKGYPAVTELIYHEMCHQYIYDVLDLEHDHCEIFKNVYRKFLTDNIQADANYV